jgi:hypothetical protein
MNDKEFAELLRRLDRIERLAKAAVEFLIIGATLYLAWRVNSNLRIIVTEYGRPDLAAIVGAIGALVVLAIGWLWRRSLNS